MEERKGNGGERKEQRKEKGTRGREEWTRRREERTVGIMKGQEERGWNVVGGIVSKRGNYIGKIRGRER